MLHDHSKTLFTPLRTTLPPRLGYTECICRCRIFGYCQNLPRPHLLGVCSWCHDLQFIRTFQVYVRNRLTGGKITQTLHRQDECPLQHRLETNTFACLLPAHMWCGSGVLYDDCHCQTLLCLKLVADSYHRQLLMLDNIQAVLHLKVEDFLHGFWWWQWQGARSLFLLEFSSNWHELCKVLACWSFS